jgi:hypothetical protein
MYLYSAGTEEFIGSTGFVQRAYGSPSTKVRVPFSARTEMFSPQVREIWPRLGHSSVQVREFFIAGTEGTFLGAPRARQRFALASRAEEAPISWR